MKGTFRDEKGRYVGCSDHRGWLGERSYEGKIYEDGTMADRYGNITGKIGDDGRVYDKWGYRTGMYFEADED